MTTLRLMRKAFTETITLFIAAPAEMIAATLDFYLGDRDRGIQRIRPKSWLDPATWNACKTRVGYSVSYRQRWFLSPAICVRLRHGV